MTKLTNQTIKDGNKQPYTDFIGAGGGTVILVFAENIPDYYWFKTSLIVVAPTLSVIFSKLTDLAIRRLRQISDHLTTQRSQRRISKRIVTLKKDPITSEEDIRQLEIIYNKIKMENLQETIVKQRRTKS